MSKRAAQLRLLQARPGPLLVGAAWDIGTARLLAHLGYEAVETSSAGLAFSTGRPDAAGLLGRDEVLDSAAAVAAAVDVPVSADLENGFGDDPALVAETIRMADARGIAGGSIEDATGRTDHSLYPLGQAVARIRAAAEAAGGGFMVTARCDGFMHGHRDLSEVILRLRAYQDAGADVLGAPGLPDRASVEAVVGALDKPVVVYVGQSDWKPDLAEMAALGVKRVTVGSGLVRVAWTGFMAAAREAQEQGTFTRVAQADPYSAFTELFRALHARAGSSATVRTDMPS
jgi:2-methylisocitrate lyase-like PEP mutase family enzyme